MKKIINKSLSDNNKCYSCDLIYLSYYKIKKGSIRFNICETCKLELIHEMSTPSANSIIYDITKLSNTTQKQFKQSDCDTKMRRIAKLTILEMCIMMLKEID